MLESPTAPVNVVKLSPKFVPPEAVIFVLFTADSPLVMLLKVKPGWLPLCIVNECMYSSELPHWSSAVTLTTLVPLPNGHASVLLTVILPFLLDLVKSSASSKSVYLLHGILLLPSIRTLIFLSLLFSVTFHIIFGVVSDVFVPFKWTKSLIVTVIVGFVVLIVTQSFLDTL